MHNSAMKDGLVRAGLVKDTAIGGVRELTPSELERVNKLKIRFAHRFQQPDLVEDLRSPQGEHHVKEQESSVVSVTETVEHTATEEIHNPFEGYLKGIEGHLLDARSRIAFTLEQARNRQAERLNQIDKLENEVLDDQVQIEKLRGQLKLLDDVTAGCNLLSEQAVQIAPLIPQKVYKETVSVSRSVVRSGRPSADDPTICRRSDVRAFFERNRGIQFSIPEIVNHMPLIKKQHAKKAMPVILAELTNIHEIERVGQGIYRVK